MAIQRINVPEGKVTEESSLIISVSFDDGQSSPADVTPTSITWTLTDGDGTIVNSRDQVAVATPAATIYIALSGDDLAVTPGSESFDRYLLVEGTYTSFVGPLPFRRQAVFEISEIVE